MSEAQQSAEQLLKGKYFFPFIAPPNGGKGTQTYALSNKFNLPKIDMGGMLRSIAQSESELGQEIRERQAKGMLVDTPIVMRVLKEGLRELAQKNPQARAYILDGFPRNQEQAEGIFRICEELGTQVAKAFYLDVPDEVITERAVNRRLCPKGEIYNLLTNPPKVAGVCDVDGEALIHRSDDHPEPVKARLKSFKEETWPILDIFRQKGLLVEINGNRPPEQVTEDLVREMQPFLNLTPA
jgi:adenylate kinase